MTKSIFKLSLLFLFVLIASCSNNDDNSSSQEQDPFIGKWIITKTFENGNEEILNDCTRQSTLEVNANGTLLIKGYDFDVNNNCVLDEDNEGIESWRNLGNNKYVLVAVDPDDNSEIIFEFTITFSGSTFTAESIDEGIVTTSVYTRI